MNILDKLNSWPMFLISGGCILFVCAMCVFFMIRAYKAGIAIGIDKTKLKRAVTSSVTFSLLPSISILLGVIALSGTLGIPLPWLRLSVIGALHYETSVADIAARNSGLVNGLRIEDMTEEAFVTIALLMSVGIIWGMVCVIFFGKAYTKKLSKPSPEKKKGSRSFGDDAMTAMFVGLISAYAGSYIATLIQMQDGKLVVTGNYLPVVTLIVSALAMGVFTYFSEKKKMAWLDNFSIAGSMLVGMASAVVLNIIF